MVNCQFCNKIFKNGGIATHQAFCKSNPNRRPVSKNHGGYRQGSGRGKKGWYKNIYCDSSWELAYILYCEQHDISIKRYYGEQLFYTSADGMTHEYIPDFIINDKDIVEIKGYETEVSDIKKFHFPNIIMLTKIEMTDILEQVISWYGKDFIVLYDNIKPIKKEGRFPKKPKPPAIKKEKQIFNLQCQTCGIKFEKTMDGKEQKYCSRICVQKSQQKFDVSKEELTEMIWKYPTTTLSNMYGVSDKAIEKRCKKFEISKPPRGYWAKNR